MTFVNEGRILGGGYLRKHDNHAQKSGFTKNNEGLFITDVKTGDFKFDSIEFLSKKEQEPAVNELDTALDGPINQPDEAQDGILELKIPDEVDCNGPGGIRDNFEFEYGETETKEAENKANLNELNQKQGNLSGQQSSLNTKLKAEQRQLASLEKQQEAIQQQQENIQNQMQNLERIMQKNPTKANQIKYQNLAQQAETLAGKMADITDAINNQTDKIADLNTQLNAVNADLAAVNEEIETVKLSEAQNKNQQVSLKAIGFLSSIVAGTINQIGFIPPMMALNFMTNMSDMLITGAKNFINQTAALSMLPSEQQAYVVMNGVNLTEQMPGGGNRYTIAFNRYGKASLCDNSMRYGDGFIGGRYDNLMAERKGFLTINLNQDGTLTAGNRYDGYADFNDFSGLAQANDMYNQRTGRNARNIRSAFNKAAFVGGSTKMGMMFNNPMNSMFKLGFMAGRRAQQQITKMSMGHIDVQFLHQDNAKYNKNKYLY